MTEKFLPLPETEPQTIPGYEESKTNSMLHNGILDLMNRSACFGHYYAHHQELATIQMVSAYGSSPWLWQVAGLVHGCRFLDWFYSLHVIDDARSNTHQIPG